MSSYDVIWIGTGQATGVVVPELAAAGQRVALIEGGAIGGSCVNFGCTPTKALVASARAAHMARRGADFGVEINDFTVNLETIRSRMNMVRDNSELEQRLRNIDGVDFFDGYAHFVTDSDVQVGDELLSGTTIVVHTGTRPYALPIAGLDEVPWLDNAGLLDLEEIPDHLVIVGGSYIGMELGQIYRRFGADVTILEGSDQLMAREDLDIAVAAREVFEAEGITVETGARVTSVASGGTGSVHVNFEAADGQQTVTGSHLLLAVGRVPNSDKLQLENAGVETTQRGHILVNDVLQTNIEHIYAIGDINGRGAFTHTSVNDGQIFLDNYLRGGDRKVTDRISIYAMYIDPPLGRIGMSEKQARETDRDILMATLPMAAIGRAKEKSETSGLIKILVDAETKEFVGVSILGTGGDEVINMFAPYMLARQPYTTFRQAVFTHPTVGEMLPWILDGLAPLT